MEREHRAEHSESDKSQREEEVLRTHRDGIFRYFENIHRELATFGSRMEVDTEDSDQQQRGTSHQHQGQLHCGILFATGSPHSDQQVHRDQGHLIKEEHRKEVRRDEESEHTDRQQRVPSEEFAGKWRHFP